MIPLTKTISIVDVLPLTTALEITDHIKTVGNTAHITIGVLHDDPSYIGYKIYVNNSAVMTIIRHTQIGYTGQRSTQCDNIGPIHKVNILLVPRTVYSAH